MRLLRVCLAKYGEETKTTFNHKWQETQIYNAFDYWGILN